MGLNSWFSELFGIHREYIDETDKHRFVFTPLRKNNQTLSKKGEIMVDDTDNGAVYYKNTDGEIVSKDKELEQKIQDLHDAGIVQSAIAFQNNIGIYRVFVKDNKVRLDDDLRISRNYRYWALRGPNPINGEMIYLTGNLVAGNRVENVLCDVTHDYSDPSISYSGTAEQGTLHTPSWVNDNHIYYIDFFDDKRVLRTSISCQSIFVSALDFALAPEKNILWLSITTNQDDLDPITGENVCFLYEGQSLDSLNVYVRAHYADGSYRNINHEIAISRLVLNMPNIPNTTQVGDEFTISAKYFTEELNIGGNTYDDSNFASIHVSKKLRIYTDVYLNVMELLPIPLVVSNAPGVRQIVLKTFARYENGSIEDVTYNSRLIVGPQFSAYNFGTLMQFDVSIGLGTANYKYLQSNVALRMSSIDFSSWEMLTARKEFPCDIARFDYTSTPGEVYMRLAIKANPTNTTTTDIINMGRIPDGTGGWITPTHFRVRSILDTSFTHTPLPIAIQDFNKFRIEDHSVPNKKLSMYSSTNNNIPYPVLLEFGIFEGEDFKKISMHPVLTMYNIIN